MWMRGNMSMPKEEKTSMNLSSKLQIQAQDENVLVIFM